MQAAGNVKCKLLLLDLVTQVGMQFFKEHVSRRRVLLLSMRVGSVTHTCKNPYTYAFSQIPSSATCLHMDLLHLGFFRLFSQGIQ